MGHMDVVSIVSDYFNIYFPIALLALTLATYFSLGARFLSGTLWIRYLSVSRLNLASKLASYLCICYGSRSPFQPRSTFPCIWLSGLCLTGLGFQQFLTQDSELTLDLVEEGKEHIKRERRRRQRMAESANRKRDFQSRFGDPEPRGNSTLFKVQSWKEGKCVIYDGATEMRYPNADIYVPRGNPILGWQALFLGISTKTRFAWKCKKLDFCQKLDLKSAKTWFLGII